jgi:hypothetical protein
MYKTYIWREKVQNYTKMQYNDNISIIKQHHLKFKQGHILSSYSYSHSISISISFPKYQNPSETLLNWSRTKLSFIEKSKYCPPNTLHTDLNKLQPHKQPVRWITYIRRWSTVYNTCHIFYMGFELKFFFFPFSFYGFRQCVCVYL